MTEVKRMPKNEAQKQLHQKCNKEACKLQYAPAFKLNGKRAINKPNQAKSPPKHSNAQKKKEELTRVPSYIRTEMEILNRLQQVNRNLKALIKPKCHCDRTQRNHKCCQPARERRDKRKAQGLKSDSRGDSIKSDAQDDHNEHKDLVEQSSANAFTDTPQQQAEKEQQPERQQRKCTCTKKCEAAAQAKNARGFKRIMQCMKPKTRTKCENCKCVQINKPEVQGKIGASTKQATEAANATFFHAKCGHHRCKQHVPGAPKQDGEEIVKPRSKRQHQPQATAEKVGRGGGKADKALKNNKATTSKQATKYEVRTEETTKKTRLGSCFKCCEKEKTPAPADDDKNKAHKVDKEAHETKPHKTIVFGHKLKKCMRFLRPKGKKPQENELSDTASAKELKKQYEERQAMHEKNKHDARHDLLTTLLCFPNPSQIHIKQVDNVEEYKLKEANKRRKQEIEERELRKEKAPTDTPTTSSLEEYFQRISERMMLAQKEADARQSIKKPNGRTYAKRKRAPQSSGPQLGYRPR